MPLLHVDFYALNEIFGLAGFDDWSQLCRQPLLWLGLGDPAVSIFAAVAEDPDRELLGRLLITWHAVLGNKPVMLREILDKATYTENEYKDLKEIFQDIADERGEINRRRLGRWIKKHEGQIVHGLRFFHLRCNTTAEKWYVELVSSVSSVSVPPLEKNVSDKTSVSKSQLRLVAVNDGKNHPYMELNTNNSEVF